MLHYSNINNVLHFPYIVTNLRVNCNKTRRVTTRPAAQITSNVLEWIATDYVQHCAYFVPLGTRVDCFRLPEHIPVLPVSVSNSCGACLPPSSPPSEVQGTYHCVLKHLPLPAHAHCITQGVKCGGGGCCRHTRCVPTREALRVHYLCSWYSGII
jgi:hypothetical protein